MTSKYVHDEKRIHQELVQGLCTFPFMQFLSGGYTPSWRPAWRPACCLKIGDLFALVISLTSSPWQAVPALDRAWSCWPPGGMWAWHLYLSWKEGRKEGRKGGREGGRDSSSRSAFSKVFSKEHRL